MPNAMRLKSRRFIFILCPSIESRHHAIALERIRAPLEQYWVNGCGHVITVDYCKDAVANHVEAFLARHAG